MVGHNGNRRNSFNGNSRKSGSGKKNGTPRNTNDISELHHHASNENLDIGALQKTEFIKNNAPPSIKKARRISPPHLKI